MVLDEVFEMQQGYVLNFSDRTMMQFFDAEFSIDIDDDKYRRFGHSKAKRLRAFFYIENAFIVAKALRALWDYRDAIRGPFEENDENEKRLKKRFFEILAQVEADNELPSTDSNPRNLKRMRHSKK